MDLAQALAEIERLKGLVTEAETKAETTVKTALDEQTKAHEKALQISYNKGYDTSKNKFESEKDGFIKKEDVDKLLADRDTSFSRQSALRDLGIKNPKKAMKLIDEDDLKSLGTEDFKSEDFVKKYGEDIVFIKGDDGQPPKKPQNFMKNNQQQKEGLTAEKYEQMSTEERNKISTAEKLALL